MDGIIPVENILEASKKIKHQIIIPLPGIYSKELTII